MRFLCVVGTRPEAIKLAPVILELARRSRVTILCSGRHTKLVREPLEWFGIKPDDQIAIGAKARTLAVRTGAMFAPMERMVAKYGYGYAAQRIAAAFGLCRRPASAVG
jgi:UDP-N-acetylglucosamine 2-epimerase (non-hydrolysing)